MKVTHKDGKTTCVVNKTEQREDDRAIARYHQLAYYYEGTVFGDHMASVVAKLKAYRADTDICPPGEVAGEDSTGD